ncbi:MAG: helix-hairpin-helix domain-containing protein [Planctomycetaceae bacterium]|nr:helix-hairpin-helix domain-containing protein [Planctomycetaceae bacterium]
MNESRDPHLLLWIQSCRCLIAAGLCVAICSAGLIASANNKPPAVIVPEKINPNTAPIASLIRLPGIGKIRAMDIIDWRTAHGPFESAASLEPIRGIGPKTIETLSPWLTFE